MSRPFLVGARLYLRGLNTADLDGPYLSWLNDQETMRFLESGRFPATRESLADAMQASSRKADSLWLAIVDRRTDKHVGNLKLGPINWIHRYASLGILIGDSAYRGQGYGQEAIELLLQHAFIQLGLNKVTAGAYDDHVACLELFKRLGFSIEGNLRSHLFREGAYHGKIVMGLLREDYVKRQPEARSSQRVSARRPSRRHPLRVSA